MWRSNGIQGGVARRGSNWVWEGEEKLVGDSITAVVKGRDVASEGRSWIQGEGGKETSGSREEAG